MASPNLKTINAVYGKISSVKLNSTTEISVLNNPVSSSKLMKVNTIMICNGTTTNVAITLIHHTQEALGGSGVEIVKDITVPSQSTMTIIDKNNQIYVEENMSIGAVAQEADKLNVVVSYEDIS